MIGTRKSNGFARSGALNETRRGSDRTMGDEGCANIQGTTLAYSSGSLTDSGNGLAVFTAGQRVSVKGGSTGNRTYIAGTVAAGSIVLTPAPADLAAGSAMYVRTV